MTHSHTKWLVTPKWKVVDIFWGKLVFKSHDDGYANFSVRKSWTQGYIKLRHKVASNSRIKCC